MKTDISEIRTGAEHVVVKLTAADELDGTLRILVRTAFPIPVGPIRRCL
jgi:hypothetical protein